MAKSKPLPPLKHLEKLVRLAFWDPTRRKTCPPKVGVGPHPEEKPVRRKGGVGPAPGRNLSAAKARAQGLPGRNTDADVLSGASATAGGTRLGKRSPSIP